MEKKHLECPVCKTRHVPLQDVHGVNGVCAATCESCGHFFKFKVTPPTKTDVKLTVNGKEYTVSRNYNVATSLLHFLRDTRASMGTKYMCREGGCGLCVVMVTKVNPTNNQEESFAINACLCPVFVCDGWKITTIEGLGNTRDGLHPIQSRLVKKNGSQCGFCSSAQIMNMYALLKTDDSPSKQKIEDAYDGILCRCTGYRSILDTMKSFADDKLSDIEELDKKICGKSGKPCSGQCTNNNSSPLCGANKSLLVGPDGEEHGKPVHMVLADGQWFRPVTLSELLNLVDKYKDKRMRLVLGNTGFGVYKDLGAWMFDYLIDLHGVKELYQVTYEPVLSVGANVTIGQLIEIMSDPDLNQNKYGHLKECVALLKRIAHTNVRNVASWAGNLMMKRLHPEFPSDIFVILETIGAQIFIAGRSAVTASELLKTDMTGAVITHMVIPPLHSATRLKFYKVARRSQNAHSYVSAGFRLVCDHGPKFRVSGKPTIVLAGISNKFNHATKTETYLQDKDIGSAVVIKGALSVLSGEVVPDGTDRLAGGIKFRHDLAVNLLSRFILSVLGGEVKPEFRSGSYPLERPLSSGKQTYGTHKEEWPLTEPLTKLEGNVQVTGEAVYINDIAPAPGELHAAFTLTDVGNARITSIDTSAAEKMSGVVKVILAKDIPGVNNAMPAPYALEEVLASGQVMYAGQAVAIVVAESEETAYTAASAVKVTYDDVKPPMLTIQDAVEKKMIFPKQADAIIVGNAEEAISKSAHVLTGEISCGTQAHFAMETQISICRPSEDGMKVYASSQWIDYAQKSVSQVLNMPCASIDVEVKRLGGAYGSKISRNFAVTSACALAAKLTNRPVRFNMDFHTNMENVGKRFPYLAKYQVGFADDGKLNGINVTYYCDCGFAVNDCTVEIIMEMGDNAYYCPNWHMIPVAVQTNTPSNTYCRAPASTPGIFVMETIMEHMAQSLGKDPIQMKQLNLYQKGQVTPGGMTLNYCSITSLYKQLENMATVSNRQKEVDAFNKANRWKKKGLSVVPLKYGVPWNSQNYGVTLAVYIQDGTVAVTHGGIEVGQGINTKAAQVCAYELGVSVELIRIKPTTTLSSAGSCFTGSSVTSELVCQGVVNACQELNKRIAPVKAKLKDPTWLKVVQECYNEGIDLVAHSWYRPQSPGYYQYNSYGVTCTEVELDVLTGEHEITRVDILFDCGESMNPFLDVGQVEGAFVMGIGYWLLEESVYDITSGKYLTNSTWDYKPATTKDIPIDFRITLLKDAPNPIGILRSKACGEPPLCMSCSVMFALKHAIQSARKDAGHDTYFPLSGPATVEVIQQACLTTVADLTRNVCQ